jgi:trans-feruloyl-CoA hydratase/vanillin synthase
MTHPLIEARLDAAVLTLGLLRQPIGGVQIEFIESLADLLRGLATRPDVRVVLLQGELDLRLDLAHWHELRRTQAVRVHRALQAIQGLRTLQLKTLPQAWLVVVDGPCTGVGLALLEGCDLALCSPASVFSLSPEQGLWLGPDSEAGFDESPQPHRRGLLHAVAGQAMSGEQAQDLGWVTFCLADSELSPFLSELTQSLLDKDPLALQFTKETLAHVPQMGWDASVNYTAAKFAEIKARQAQAGGPSARSTAISGFLAGQSKPGLKG